MPNKATSVSLPRTDLNGFLMSNPSVVNYLALGIMPSFSVPDKTGNFSKVPLAAMLTPQGVDRAVGSNYQRSDHTMSEDTYAVKEYGHEQSLDDGERRTYNKLGNYDEVVANRLRNILLLKQELRVVAVCHNTTTFTQSGNTGLAVTNEWDDNANATPIDDIQVGKEGIRARGGPTNNLVLQVAWGTWLDLWRCDQILQNIKYVVGGKTPDMMDIAARAEMAKQLGVKDILVADAYYNSAADNATVVIADVWTKEYAFLFNRPQSQDLSEPCFARTMTWEEDGGLFAAEQYRDESRRSDILRVRQWTQEKTLLTAEAFLLSNIYTA